MNNRNEYISKLKSLLNESKKQISSVMNLFGFLSNQSCSRVETLSRQNDPTSQQIREHLNLPHLILILKVSI